jgi:hypothetical protein
LPGRAFGKAFSTTIAPIVSVVLPGVGEYEGEADVLRDLIQARINTTRDQIPLYQFATDDREPYLDDKQAGAIEWLLTHAEAEMAAAIQLHDKWLYRVGGAYPLAAGDTLAGFPGADCSAQSDGTRPVLPYGKPVVGVDGQLAYCPTYDELQQRPKDRAAIVVRFKDALQHVRCAEYGLWKLVMVHQALEALSADELPLAGEPGEGTAKGPPPPRKHVQKFLEQLLPDPDDLPPADVVTPEAGEEPPPEGEGEPEPPQPTKAPKGRTAVLAAAGAATALLLWRSLR